MYSLWFVHPMDDAQNLHVDVRGLLSARMVWDGLQRAGFRMVSQRP